MSDALLRHWHLLRALPRAPRKTTTAQIEARLRGAGFPIDRRSIERDLHKLSATFPLECDDRSRPFGWSWARDAEAFDLPGMDPQTALVLQLAGAHLRPLLPPSDLARLEPFFAQAKAYEKSDPASGERFTWRQGESLDELLEKERLRAEREGTSPRPERPARRKNLPLVSVLADEPEEEDPEDRACLICEL
jgi:hypothetical protein